MWATNLTLPKVPLPRVYSELDKKVTDDVVTDLFLLFFQHDCGAFIDLLIHANDCYEFLYYNYFIVLSYAAFIWFWKLIPIF